MIATKARRAALGACIAITIAALPFISGCAGGSSSQENAALGGYSVAPSSVDSSSITQPESCMIITAAAQNQAFKIPATALSHAKAAIEQGNYAGYVSADESASPHGKVFSTTKNSEAGKLKELESFEAEYFSAACAERSENGGIDLLSAMNDAADTLRANSGESGLVVCVIASGINDAGVLRTTQDLVDADPNAIVSQLLSLSAISNYEGVTFRFYGLGQATGSEQDIPASVQAKLKALYAAIVEAGGGTAVVESDVLSPLGCDADLPEVAAVSFEKDALSIPHVERGQSAQVTLDEAKLAFLGDSSEFANASQAESTLSELARAIVSNGYVARVEGFTATSPEWSHDDLASLSQARADAVKSALVSMGVDASKIEAVGRADDGATSMVSGAFDEAAASADRKVVVTLSLA